MISTIKPIKKHRWHFSFNDCVSKMEDFKTGRQYMTSRLQANTYLLRKEDHYSIALHGTEIIRIYQNGSFVLSEGAWHTPTTFKRLHDYSPVPIKQKGKDWYVLLEGKHEVKFSNGMTVNKLGQLI